MYLRIYRLPKKWLNQPVKSAISEHPLTFNVLMGAKHLWNLHHSTFIIFFDHSERKLFAKHLLYSKLKSQVCLFTHWLPMTSILFGIVTICSSLFKCNFLKNEKLFLNFLFLLWNLHQIFNIFKQKMIVIANVFPRLQTVKAWVDHSLKNAVSEDRLTFNMWKDPKHLWNLYGSTFIIFFDHSEWKWFAKYLPYWNLKP